MLERIDLVDKTDSMPRQLSGGQSQRIALARALINQPRVLLLDEPLGALDAKLRKSMQIELKHVHDSLGITFIYVTHDQEEALVMSDRIAVMSGGRIVQLGRPDDIFERPRNRFVAEFIGTANFLAGRITDATSGAHRIALAHGPVWTTTAFTEAVAGDAVTVAVRPPENQGCTTERRPGGRSERRHGDLARDHLRRRVDPPRCRTCAKRHASGREHVGQPAVRLSQIAAGQRTLAANPAGCSHGLPGLMVFRGNYPGLIGRSVCM